jgi:hypothetical protein
MIHNPEGIENIGEFLFVLDVGKSIATITQNTVKIRLTNWFPLKQIILAQQKTLKVKKTMNKLGESIFSIYKKRVISKT